MQSPVLGFCSGGQGRGHYTKNIPGFSDVNSVNPSVLEMSPAKSCPAFEGGVKLCPGFQRRMLLARPALCWFFPGIQLMKFGLFLSHSCSPFMI